MSEEQTEENAEEPVTKARPKPLWFTIAIVLFGSPILAFKVWYEGWNPLRETLPGTWGKVVFTVYLVILCALLLRRGWHKNRPYNP